MTKKTTTNKAFIQHKNNGFRLNFPNGNSLSTVWEATTYSDNNESAWSETENGKKLSSNTVETMPECSDKVLKMLEEAFPEADNGGVFGYLSFDQWLEMVNILATNK